MPGTEVLNELQADQLALLRMELAGHNIVVPDAGNEPNAISGHCRDDRSISWFNEIGMDEIPVGRIRNTGKYGAVSLPVRLVPPHVGHFQLGHRRESLDPAGNDAKAFM